MRFYGGDVFASLHALSELMQQSVELVLPEAAPAELGNGGQHAQLPRPR